MSKLLLVVVCVIAHIFVPASVSAADYCPKKISAITGGPISQKLAPIMQEIYNSLGCTLEISFLPGKRGIMSFNKQLVDGEMLRLPVIEDKYQRQFIRSSVPILKMYKGVWERPGTIDAEVKVIGYTFGIAWQENYIKENQARFPRVIKFLSDNELFKAYSNGQISGFLSEDKTISEYARTNGFQPAPFLKEAIEVSHLHHYLGQEYSKFMQDFSNHVREHKPFSNDKPQLN